MIDTMGAVVRARYEEDGRLPEKPPLTINTLCNEAAKFAEVETKYDEPKLFGVTDGKAVGTYLEHKFLDHLLDSYEFPKGNSASGIDIPGLKVDIKVTSIVKPQSSTPFKSPDQKIYGLGHHLIIFTYEKHDDYKNKTGRLNIENTVFIESDRTADFQMTRGLCEIIDNEGNEDDIIALLLDKNLLVDDIQATKLATRILNERPKQGYLTISNAYQWRLSFNRAIKQAGGVSGIKRIR